MHQYTNACNTILKYGTRKPNRTGVDTFSVTGLTMQFDLREGFPLLTTKRVAWRSCVAEMLGFLRGYDSAAQFRELGCKVWDANANENEEWLANPLRKGEDDLGAIYGVQWRQWNGHLDQLESVYRRLLDRNDDRRLVVTAWEPDSLDCMALPPCHLLFQFTIEGDVLNLCMYQRSADFPLGVPFNIAGYSWLLAVMAHVTGLQAGQFTHFLCDCHIYENQVEPLREQLARTPRERPSLHINPEIETLNDLETWVTVEDFDLEGYNPWPKVEFPFAV